MAGVYSSKQAQTALIMEVLVFKTSVKYKKDVKQLSPMLDNLSAIEQWNFDLEDPDRILRIESDEDVTYRVKEALSLNGFECEELAD